MGRGATCALIGNPESEACSMRRRISRQPSGVFPACASDKDSGRPDTSTILRIIPNSVSRSGVAPESMEIHQPSLDDVFLAATGHRLEGADREPATQPETEGAAT